MRKVNILILQFLIVCVSFLFGQEMIFEHLTKDKGLADNYVNYIYQDNLGFIWFCTRNGLSRYDGYKFTNYNHDPNDANTLSDFIVTCIYQDKESIFWIGTKNGLNRFDPVTEKFTCLNLEDTGTNKWYNWVTAIEPCQFGGIWVGFRSGLYRILTDSMSISMTNTMRHKSYDLNGIKSIYYPCIKEDPQSLNDEQIYSLLEDKKGNLWIGTDNGGGDDGALHKLEPGANHDYPPQFKQYKHNRKNPETSIGRYLMSIYEDRYGNLWIGTWEDGLYKFNPHTEKIVRFRNDPKNPNSINNNNIYIVQEDKMGNLWIATYGGGLNKIPAHLVNSASPTFIHYTHDPSLPSGLSYNHLRSVYFDRSDVMWISTLGNGVDRFFQNRFIEHYHHDPDNPNSLGEDHVYAIYEDKNGIIWIGSGNGYLNRFDPNRNTFHSYKVDIKTRIIDQILSIAEKSDHLLILGTDKGIIEFNTCTKRFTDIHSKTNLPDSLKNYAVNSICRNSKNNLFIGFYDKNGLYVEEDENRYRNIPGEIILVNTIFEDSRKNLWIGTRWNGIFILDPQLHIDTVLIHRQPEYNSCHAFIEDRYGIIWGALEVGLVKINPDNYKCNYIFDKTNFKNNQICGLVKEDERFIWVSTQNGLSKFDMETETSYNFDEDDGLSVQRFLERSFYKSRTGKIYLGTNKGLISFNPDDIKSNKSVPQVVITDFEIFNQDVHIGEKIEGKVVLERSILNTSEVVLSHKANMLYFEFAALDFQSSSDNQYAYKMTGVDKDWIYAISDRRFSAYTGLQPGEYVYQVKASNNDGVWNEEGIQLKITITPPFWATWWFRGLIIFIVVLLIYIIFRIRLHSIKRRSKELEKKVIERTKELYIAKRETDYILQNVKDGLFLLDHDYKIESQYSTALERILSEDNLAKKSFTNYLQHKIDPEIVQNVKDYLDILFDKDFDEETLSQLNPLSQIEINLNGHGIRYLTFDFRRIKEKERTVRIIASVNDITEKIQLEKDLEETKEENKRKMDWLLCILNVEPIMLREFIKTANEEIHYVDEILHGLEQKEQTLELLDNIYRSIHTIKGSASLLELDFFAEKAHQVEDKIAEIRNKDQITLTDINKLLEQTKMIQSVYDEVKGLLDQISQIHDQFRPKRSHEQNMLIKSLSKLVKNLGEELGKKTKFNTEKYQNGLVPYQHRLLIRDVLVQLIRNSMYHGIEMNEERKALSKPVAGLIELRNYTSNNHIIIEYKDDGRGLQLEKLREKAKELGKWSSRELDKWTPKQLSAIIFEAGLSMAEKVSIVAGRGMGMSIIQEKISKIGGKIEIETQEGEYCKFIIEIPKNSQ